MKILKEKKLLIALLVFFGIAMISNVCFAEGIGTAEVNTATENIKRVITSIAMPLRRCSNICKCCSGCN